MNVGRWQEGSSTLHVLNPTTSHFSRVSANLSLCDLITSTTTKNHLKATMSDLSVHLETPHSGKYEQPTGL